MAITLDLARVHLKADNESIEDDLITGVIASAQTICEDYCNRKFYEDAVARAADFTAALADQTTLTADRDALLATLTDCDQIQMVWSRYYQDIGDVKQRINGIVINPAITAAMLWTIGNLYVDRSDDGKPPEKAKRILEPYLWPGDLAV